VIGEVIEHLLFLRGEVEKYAEIKNRDSNKCLVGGSSALLKLPWTMK
jgi:hypothetical protein